jgi:two-component system sensor histidine kinase AlgZ
VLLGGELAIRLARLLLPFDVNLSRRGVFTIGGLICTTIVLVITAYERVVGRARALELREVETRREAMRAQLEALQARTNPHFLFNSLNAVAALVEEDPKRAETMLERLAALLRYSVERSRQADVPLVDELESVRMYLDVERERFGPRLESSVSLEDGLEQVRVPPLLLQPLVENAVLHGVATRREGGRVHVVARRHSGRLLLEVEDDGPGPGASTHRGTGTALADLRRRLSLASSTPQGPK